MENENSSAKSGAGIWESSPKVTFALGLVAGIAIMATIALVIVLNFLMSGKGFKALAATGGTNPPAAAAQPTQPTDVVPEQPAGPLAEVDEATDHILGPKDAKVTLVEYSDFECPYCLRHNATMDQIKATYKNDVRVIFRHFPLSFHPQAQKAAEASECAADQGKFWEMHDAIFAANEAGTMSVDKWKSIAKDLGLDSAKFDKCLDSGEKAADITQDETEGQMAGVQGTPATFINGELVSGAIPFESFKQIIEQAGAVN